MGSNTKKAIKYDSIQSWDIVSLVPIISIDYRPVRRSIQDI